MVFVLDNTAVIVTNRTGFSLQEEPIFHITILIADNGIPPLTSTNTLTIYVCDCDDSGSTQACANKGLMFSMGFRTEVMIAMLVCVVVIFGKRCWTEHVFILELIRWTHEWGNLIATCVHSYVCSSEWSTILGQMDLLLLWI